MATTREISSCGRYFITGVPRDIRRNLLPDDFSDTRINPFLTRSATRVGSAE